MDDCIFSDWAGCESSSYIFTYIQIQISNNRLFWTGRSAHCFRVKFNICSQDSQILCTFSMCFGQEWPRWLTRLYLWSPTSHLITQWDEITCVPLYCSQTPVSYSVALLWARLHDRRSSECSFYWWYKMTAQQIADMFKNVLSRLCVGGVTYVSHMRLQSLC